MSPGVMDGGREGPALAEGVCSQMSAGGGAAAGNNCPPTTPPKPRHLPLGEVALGPLCLPGARASSSLEAVGNNKAGCTRRPRQLRHPQPPRAPGLCPLSGTRRVTGLGPAASGARGPQRSPGAQERAAARPGLPLVQARGEQPKSKPPRTSRPAPSLRLPPAAALLPAPTSHPRLPLSPSP